MDISLITHIIQILDEQQKYPRIAEFRNKRNELLYLPEYEIDMTEEKFQLYWNEILELLEVLNYNVKCLETEAHSTQEQEKLLKDLTPIVKGS